MFQVTVCPSSGDNCVYATLGTCHSVWMTVWCAGWNIPPCTPDSHLHTITSTKCQINTLLSPDDGPHGCTKHAEINKNKCAKKNCAQC